MTSPHHDPRLSSAEIGLPHLVGGIGGVLGILVLGLVLVVESSAAAV